MIKLDCIKEASRLAFIQMRPGVLTNHVMTTDEYREDIARGNLYFHVWAGGILFLRKRETYHMLSFCVNETCFLPHCVLPDDVFTEIAYKPDGVGKATRAVEFWKQVGLQVAYERVRLTRPSGANVTCTGMQEASIVIQPATIQDTESCKTLLYNSFDHITGHIPDNHELIESIKTGHVLCMKDPNGNVCGLLRFSSREASLEIRQLALREDMRGRGLASELITHLIKLANDKKITVWARDGYVPAIKSYTTSGFAPDGWRSTVLV